MSRAYGRSAKSMPCRARATWVIGDFPGCLPAQICIDLGKRALRRTDSAQLTFSPRRSPVSSRLTGLSAAALSSLRDRV
jgi:hypothetical protein